MSAEEYLKNWFLEAHHPKDKSDKEIVSISWGACEEIMDGFAREYHAKEMEGKLEEAESHFKYSSEKQSIDFVDGVLSALNHLKEDKG